MVNLREFFDWVDLLDELDEVFTQNLSGQVFTVNEVSLEASGESDQLYMRDLGFFLDFGEVALLVAQNIVETSHDHYFQQSCLFFQVFS